MLHVLAASGDRVRACSAIHSGRYESNKLTANSRQRVVTSGKPDAQVDVLDGTRRLGNELIVRVISDRLFIFVILQFAIPIIILE